MEAPRYGLPNSIHNNISIMNWSLLVTVTYVLLGSQRLWLIENMIISFSP